MLRYIVVRVDNGFTYPFPGKEFISEREAWDFLKSTLQNGEDFESVSLDYTVIVTLW